MVFDSIIADLQEYYEAFISLLPQFITGILVLFIFWVLSKILKRILQRALDPKFEDKLVLRFILKTVNLIFFGIAVLVFLKIIGLGDIAMGIWGTAGIGAFVIGFAFKDIGEHFLAGFILAFNRPFGIGDVIEVDDRAGKVVGLNLRNTHIKSFDGKDVYIPNGIVVKHPLSNYTIDGFLRNEFEIEIKIDADIDKATSIIYRVINEHPYVLKNKKKPDINIAYVGNQSIKMRVLYWIDTTDENVNTFRIRLELVRGIVEQFNRNQIDFPERITDLSI